MRTYLYQINITRDCNLRCTHCYIHSDVKKASQSMTIDQIVALAKNIRSHMESIGYDRAEIHIIGGEPTMLGLPFFQAAIPEINKVFDGADFTYDLSLVTNLLSDEILDICRLFKHVSTSYEPLTRFPKAYHENQWLANVKLLKQNGIDVGVTTAVTKQTIAFGAAKLLDFYESIGLTRVHFGFFIPEGDGLINSLLVFPKFHETSQYLIDASEWYIPRRGGDMWLNPFESLVSSIHDGQILDDIVCPIISGSIDVNWDGNVVTCIEEGGGKNPDWLGNAFKDNIEEITSSDKFMQKVIDARRPKPECNSCDEYDNCLGGCGVLHGFWKPQKDLDCPGFKGFIKYVRQKCDDGLMPRYVEYVGRGCSA